MSIFGERLETIPRDDIDGQNVEIRLETISSTLEPVVLPAELPLRVGCHGEADQCDGKGTADHEDRAELSAVEDEPTEHERRTRQGEPTEPMETDAGDDWETLSIPRGGSEQMSSLYARLWRLS